MSAKTRLRLFKEALKAKAPQKTNPAPATTANLPPDPVDPSKQLDHGRHIFVYSHLMTNQVIYSLTRSPNNTSSLNQLPYNGKKTRPPALRKDHWLPMCSLSFPTSSLGLSAFRYLREFRRLHELSWDKSLIDQKPTEWIASKMRHYGKVRWVRKADQKRAIETGVKYEQNLNRPMTRRERGWALCDQKANSVADMAAVIQHMDIEKAIGGGYESWEIEAVKKAEAEAANQEQKKAEALLEGQAAESEAKSDEAKPAITSEASTEASAKPEGKEGEAKKEGEEEEVAKEVEKPYTGPTVLLRWADIRDAEYAQEWPRSVIHSTWEVERMKKRGQGLLDPEFVGYQQTAEEQVATALELRRKAGKARAARERAEEEQAKAIKRQERAEARAAKQAARERYNLRMGIKE